MPAPRPPMQSFQMRALQNCSIEIYLLRFSFYELRLSQLEDQRDPPSPVGIFTTLSGTVVPRAITSFSRLDGCKLILYELVLKPAKKYVSPYRWKVTCGFSAALPARFIAKRNPAGRLSRLRIAQRARLSLAGSIRYVPAGSDLLFVVNANGTSTRIVCE